MMAMPWGQYGRVVARAVALVVLTILVLSCGILSYLLWHTINTYDVFLGTVEPEAVATAPFPLGVDPLRREITQQPHVTDYLATHFAADFARTQKLTWFDRVEQRLLSLPWYQSIASPSSRILVIYPGERKEEIAENFASILGWNTAEKMSFIENVSSAPLRIADGTFFPGKYVVAYDTPPEAVAELVRDAFIGNVLERYPSDIAAVIPLSDTLIVASLIEREASSFSDMQAVSGVIWRRLFDDMKLQLDASLQYARANQPSEPAWWPVPVPDDKYIDSPFNTYQHEGLPPSPIANPSAAAIIAALNPTSSDCLFYFHSRRALYCSATYEEHVEKLQAIYGVGR